MGFLNNFVILFNDNNKPISGNVTIQEQYETFKQLGFVLNDGIDFSEVLKLCPTNYTAKEPPYHHLYIILGQSTEAEPWTPFTNQCWNFDIEAIEDHGSYIDILNNISRITNGELVFENVEDYVDIDEETAWVSFTCRGDKYKWDLVVDNDWTDGRLFDKIQELTVKYNTKGKFTYFNTYGQDFVLGFHTPEALDKIRQATGLEIVRLKAQGQIY